MRGFNDTWRQIPGFQQPKEDDMCVMLVGGLDRLKRDYQNAATRCGVRLKVFTGKESCLMDKMGQVDRAIVFTSMVSHSARDEVSRRGKSMGIPVTFLHTNGVSGLYRCLKDISSDNDSYAH
jgi:hypothetical protein